MTKFNNVSEQYDEQISLITHNVSMLEGFVSQSEAAGYMASEVYYKAMADKQQENITQLQGEYSSLLSAFDEAVKNGSIEKYSSDWYDMLGNINDVEQSLQDATTQLIEFNQTLQQLSWEVFDRIRESVNDITTEAEFLIDVLDSKDLHTDKGVITDEGLAVQGLHAVNYNTYMEQALAYAEEMRKIEAEMAKDPYDMELVDRRNELLELQQEAISSAMSEKEAIHSLWEEGYNKMLESLDKLISKRKEALQAEKDMYDYQNSIKEKTDTVKSYQKQLQAYAGDNSEEAKSTIQKIEMGLYKAEKDLKETEYDKWLSDQELMLDSLYNQTEEWINTRLDNVDGLITETVLATNKNAGIISDTIYEASRAFGYKLSSKMEAIWNRNDIGFNGIKNVVGIYGDVLYGILQTVDGDINAATAELSAKVNQANLNIDKNGNLIGSYIYENGRVINNNMNQVGLSIGAYIDKNGNVVSTTMSNGMTLLNGTLTKIGTDNATISNSIMNGTTIVNNTLNSIKNEMANVITAINRVATNNANSIAQAQNTVVNNQSTNIVSTYTPSTPTTTHTSTTVSTPTTQTQTSNNKKPTTTPKYNILNQDGIIINSNLTEEEAKKIVSANGHRGWKMVKAYKRGTTNAEKGFNLVSDGNGDEIIITNDGNAVLAKGMQLFPFEGGETVFDASKTAELLKGGLVPLSAEQLWGNIVKTPKLPDMVGRGRNNVENDIHMNIAVKANNYDEFCSSFKTAIKTDPQCRKLLQAVTIDESIGKNSLSRNKY